MLGWRSSFFSLFTFCSNIWNDGKRINQYKFQLTVYLFQIDIRYTVCQIIESESTVFIFYTFF
jgi:hypothetical protein